MRRDGDVFARADRLLERIAELGRDRQLVPSVSAPEAKRRVPLCLSRPGATQG